MLATHRADASTDQLSGTSAKHKVEAQQRQPTGTHPEPYDEQPGEHTRAAAEREEYQQQEESDHAESILRPAEVVNQNGRRCDERRSGAKAKVVWIVVELWAKGVSVLTRLPKSACLQ